MQLPLPSSLLESLEGLNGFRRESFIATHAGNKQLSSIRFNPLKPIQDQLHDPGLPIGEKIPWTANGYYLEERPSFTFDPLFHAGCYYVQEASSMFIEQVFRQVVDCSKPLKILDLSAAPGGKSTHIQSLITKESLLVSNEVIRSRANTLKDNMIKWGSSNVVVTHNDPRDFSPLEGYFDVIVVDAPCSGSGLFRREPDAILEWSEQQVALCSQRQQRILTDIWPALKEDGILVYSTCSYSKQEDEDIVDWVKNNLPAAYCPLHMEKSWGISESSQGYRFWPDKVKGEGFFLAVFKKTGGVGSIRVNSRQQPLKVTQKEADWVSRFANISGLQLIRYEDTVYGWPESLQEDLAFLLEKLRVIYSGTRIGMLVRDKLIPDHALAMSPLVNAAIHSLALDRETAIAFLQKKEIRIETSSKGWQLVKYAGMNLGWINVLPNRINNYYPKEFRILMESPRG